ncbi:DUF2637 domain-containing protein [Streptacidiphilus sp. MAP5-3]|uniref:DUF2637 domain-containing protein n=1 Tax=unclassified Streptacidiphilus TaxID=2643834 RepID=UPI0035156646
MTTTTPPARQIAGPPHHAGWWDRVAIALLGVVGCALSYDALRQMAFAIHVRPALTWLFPIVIDGFIAYGVRALLVLRGAPFRARLYVWTLFATATAASIWANALHAIRLNQLAISGKGELHLGDSVVGVLSTIAPLALAGATHLFILISRHGQHAPAARTQGGPLAAGTGTGPSGLSADAAGPGAETSMIPAVPVPVPVPADTEPDTGTVGAVPDGAAGTGSAGTPASVAALVPGTTALASGDDAESTMVRPVPAGQTAGGDSGGAVRTARLGRPAGASIPELAQVLGAAPMEGGRITRAKARSVIEAAGLSAGNERIKEAVQLLDHGPAALSHPDAD